MSRLEGRTVIVTGAGRGLGREHALLLGALGAAVVVNDLGGDVAGAGTDLSPGQEVVQEIEALGGLAIVSGHDVSDWDQAGALVELAVEAFGNLHGLVNNAGILRDRTLANMTQDDWDAVLSVHLRGHAACTHHAIAYWRAQAKAGNPVKASIVNTTSVAGFTGNFGQANYSAAKAGILALSRVAHIEGASSGVRSNVVSPAARTRLSLNSPGAAEVFGEPSTDGSYDRFDPANVSPVVAWLLEEDCPASGQILHVDGNAIAVVQMPTIVNELETDGRWTLEELDAQLPDKLVAPSVIGDFVDIL